MLTDTESGCIRFPFYRHIFDDELTDFANQLDYHKSVGEIVGLDDAYAIISGAPPHQRP